ncbi:MAG: hypothetical protein IT381_03705 [Deltaproteobacteria bacterium]|nr:hypothetical protein [Deltaproteobacteria bacterium]
MGNLQVGANQNFGQINVAVLTQTDHGFEVSITKPSGKPEIVFVKDPEELRQKLAADVPNVNVDKLTLPPPKKLEGLKEGATPGATQQQKAAAVSRFHLPEPPAGSDAKTAKAVAAVQEYLAAQGLANALGPQGADGILGPNTTGAIALFKKQHPDADEILEKIAHAAIDPAAQKEPAKEPPKDPPKVDQKPTDKPADPPAAPPPLALAHPHALSVVYGGALKPGDKDPGLVDFTKAPPAYMQKYAGDLQKQYTTVRDGLLAKIDDIDKKIQSGVDDSVKPPRKLSDKEVENLGVTRNAIAGWVRQLDTDAKAIATGKGAADGESGGADIKTHNFAIRLQHYGNYVGIAPQVTRKALDPIGGNLDGVLGELPTKQARYYANEDVVAPLTLKAKDTIRLHTTSITTKGGTLTLTPNPSYPAAADNYGFYSVMKQLYGLPDMSLGQFQQMVDSNPAFKQAQRLWNEGKPCTLPATTQIPTIPWSQEELAKKARDLGEAGHREDVTGGKSVPGHKDGPRAKAGAAIASAVIGGVTLRRTILNDMEKPGADVAKLEAELRALDAKLLPLIDRANALSAGGKPDADWTSATGLAADVEKMFAAGYAARQPT